MRGRNDRGNPVLATKIGIASHSFAMTVHIFEMTYQKGVCHNILFIHPPSTARLTPVI